jgi:PKD repeat protein
MKTNTFKKRLLQTLLVTAGVFFLNAASACSASFTYNIGVNGHVTFTNTSIDSVYASFGWNFGDGSSIPYANSAPVTHIYTANGTYKVVLTLHTDTIGCSSSDTVYITITNVTTPCTLSANYTYTINAGGAVSFTSTSTGTNSKTQYYWNPDDNGSPTVLGTSTYSHTYIYNGNYQVWLYIKDTGSAYCYDSIMENVYVTNADSNACHLHASFTYSIGLNGHVTFTNTSTSIYSSTPTSSWNFGNGDTAFTNNSSYNYIYLANGTYTVTLTSALFDSTCSTTAQQVITISNVTVPCTLSAGFNVVNDTTTGQIQFIGTSTGTNAGTEYFWQDSAGGSLTKAGSSYTTKYAKNGTYTAWLYVKDTGTAFCADSISEIVNVSNVDSLHASFVDSLYTDTVGYYRYYFVSTSTGVNGVTMYAWEPGDTTAGDTGLNMTTYYHTYMYPGYHTVTLSVWFSKYPVIGHNTGGGNDKHAVFYQLSTYKMVIDIKPAGIANIEGTSSDMKLYPNPNKGLFRLDIGDVGSNTNATLQVTNLLGEVVYQTTASASNGAIVKDIDLSNVSNGTYFVRIITPDKVYNTKAVINR